MRLMDLKQKEVINTKDGVRYGFVNDIEFNEETGKIEYIIIPVHGKMFGMFVKGQEYKIHFNEIKRIGDDIVIVEVNTKDVLVDSVFWADFIFV